METPQHCNVNIHRTISMSCIQAIISVESSRAGFSLVARYTCCLKCPWSPVVQLQEGCLYIITRECDNHLNLDHLLPVLRQPAGTVEPAKS